MNEGRATLEVLSILEIHRICLVSLILRDQLLIRPFRVFFLRGRYDTFTLITAAVGVLVICRYYSVREQICHGHHCSSPFFMWDDHQ